MPTFNKYLRPVRKANSALQSLIANKSLVLGRSRAHYKDVWNFVATDEDEAKVSVAGYTDEQMLSHTANCTVELLVDCVGVHHDDVILEIGAGVGRVGQVLAPRCKEWIGADVSENMLKYLSKRLAKFNNVRTVALSGYDLGPIPSASIDLVYCTVVFMHLSEWDRFNYIKEGMRVLKPGGRMLVDNFNLLNDEGWEFFLQNKAYEPLKRAANISQSSTPQELETYFRRANFKDIKQKESGMWIVTYGVKP